MTETPKKQRKPVFQRWVGCPRAFWNTDTTVRTIPATFDEHRKQLTGKVRGRV